MVLQKSVNGVLIELTADEIAERAADEIVGAAEQKARVLDMEKSAILDALAALDGKSIRALRNGDVDRISSIEAEAEELRGQLRLLN